MSILQADTLKDSAGANTMTVADLNQGRAKAWHVSNGTGVIAIYDSFNVSSLTDNATGDISASFTVARPNANLAIVGAARTSGVVGYIQPANELSTTALMRTLSVSSAAASTDFVYHQAILNGDA